VTPHQAAASFVPDWSLHPGAVLRDVLRDRGIRQSELAARTGLTPKHVNQLVKENIGISGDVAVRLERALGLPARFWTQVDAEYAAYISHQAARDRLPELIEWAGKFDAPTLRRHHIIADADDDETIAEKLLRFFGVAGIGPFEETWLRPRVSFRRSQAFTVAEQNSALWLRLVDRCAAREPVEIYAPSKLRKVARALAPMTTLPILDAMLAARRALADAGVALVFIRQVPKTRVSAATWWTDPNRPAIGMTERHRREDMLWFSLLHEVAHLLLHPKRTTFLDLDDDRENPDVAEDEANKFAEQALLPVGATAKIVAATSRQDLALLAASFGIGTSIVAGRHGFLTDRWDVGGPLRKTVSDQDFDALEELCAEG
jgi:HTH-type transcriptional regulator / antitoxin HigA